MKNQKPLDIKNVEKTIRFAYRQGDVMGLRIASFLANAEPTHRAFIDGLIDELTQSESKKKIHKRNLENKQ